MTPRTAFAMVQTERRKLEPRDVVIPEIDDDSALLRIEACGICGSDYEQFEGVLRTPMPVIPGHEPLGIIEKIGDRAAARWKVDVGDFEGVSVAGWNEHVGVSRGLSIGILNRAQELEGIQIGILNYAGNNRRFPWLPFINAHF